VAKLVWTEEALRWLEDIFEYIAHDNPDAAARTVQAIYDRTQALTRVSATRARSVTFEFSFMSTTALRIS
jgi:plasmid stabilization system protein ParE